MSRFRELLPQHFFLDTWRQLDDEATAARAEREGHDWWPLIAMISGAIMLTLMEYWGMPNWARELLDGWAADGTIGPWWVELKASRWYELAHHGYWAVWRVLGFFLLPAAIIKLRGERIRDHGLSVEGFWDHAWIYGICFVVVLICVVTVSFDTHFQTYYPFYDLSSRSWFDFLSWELLYAAQFFSLEFFFRGWWLQSGRRSMGSSVIFAMTVPYVMIHFGKPMIETVGAAIAGVVLGTLAMKTRSIWSGFLIHVSVALSMDFASMIQRGALPSQWFPS